MILDNYATRKFLRRLGLLVCGIGVVAIFWSAVSAGSRGSNSLAWSDVQWSVRVMGRFWRNPSPFFPARASRPWDSFLHYGLAFSILARRDRLRPVVLCQRWSALTFQISGIRRSSALVS